MNLETCDSIQLELSMAHDEGRHPEGVDDHLSTCADCTLFQRSLRELDNRLSVGSFDRAPDVSPEVMVAIGRSRLRWLGVAAALFVGLGIGALVGGLGTRGDVVQARDLGQLLHQASPSVDGLTAGLLIVERGWHPDVPERVYTGELSYAAPESLAFSLVDTTAYPGEGWLPNDVTYEFSNGELVSTATSRCPVAALPDCQLPPSTTAFRELHPFDDGLLVPLEIVGPTRTLTWWSGLEVLGAPMLEGRATLQVETTTAAVELIGALTSSGGWRESHPTDRVVMWLDESTLVPVRIEVFAVNNAERELWAIRHEYAGDDTDVPYLIIQLNDLEFATSAFGFDLPSAAPSAGFTDVALPQPPLELPDGFRPHRSGTWFLPDEGVVEVWTWSDGRSWLMVEMTGDWSEASLFGVALPFVEVVDLGGGSVGYLSPEGDAVAIHGDSIEALVSGSVSSEDLISVAASLEIVGQPVPSDWDESSVVGLDEIPSGVLVPEGDGWSLLARTEESETVLVMTGSGARTVLISQQPGDRLAPPTGADFVAVEVRGVVGRYDANRSILEWVEDGQVIGMRSETVGVGEMTTIADSMERR